MTDAEKLSLAYQLMAQAPATYSTLAAALAKVNADAAALLPPAPAAGAVVGVRRVIKDGAVIEHVEILGDGTERPVGV